MGHDLGPVEVTMKAGQEPFHVSGRSAGFDLLSFWQWSSSDLLSNQLRGVLAEYLVGRALGLHSKPRMPWDPYDFQTRSGIRVEVKSGAYLQSWFQRRLTDVYFSVAPSTAWDRETDTWGTERKRQADVYVLALLQHQDKATVDPLNLDQWCFYVVRTSTLSGKIGDRKSLSLKQAKQLAEREVAYAELAAAVEEVGLCDA